MPNFSSKLLNWLGLENDLDSQGLSKSYLIDPRGRTLLYVMFMVLLFNFNFLESLV